MSDQKTTDEEIKRVSAAIQEADDSFGYSMSLIRLVDGISTYRLRYDEGEELFFGGTGEVYEHVALRRNGLRARAAIAAIRGGTP